MEICFQYSLQLCDKINLKMRILFHKFVINQSTNAFADIQFENFSKLIQEEMFANWLIKSNRNR